MWGLDHKWSALLALHVQINRTNRGSGQTWSLTLHYADGYWGQQGAVAIMLADFIHQFVFVGQLAFWGQADLRLVVKETENRPISQQHRAPNMKLISTTYANSDCPYRLKNNKKKRLTPASESNASLPNLRLTFLKDLGTFQSFVTASVANKFKDYALYCKREDNPSSTRRLKLDPFKRPTTSIFFLTSTKI